MNQCSMAFGARQIARIAVIVTTCKLIQEASCKSLVKKSQSYRACRDSNRFQLLAPNSSRCDLVQDFDLFVDVGRMNRYTDRMYQRICGRAYVGESTLLGRATRLCTLLRLRC